MATLYRFFDDNGDLLYLGVTERGPTRFYEHSGQKSWWGQVTTGTFTHYSTWDEALNAERAAVEAENPQFNIKLKGATPSVRIRLRHADRGRCIHCGDDPIASKLNLCKLCAQSWWRRGRLPSEKILERRRSKRKSHKPASKSSI